MLVELSLASAKWVISERDEHFGTQIKGPHGVICVKTGGQFSPCKHSITEFVINDEARGKGHGTEMLKGVIRKYKEDIGGQVSSAASLHVFHKLGFRPAMKLDASLEETVKLFKEEWGSLYMVYKPAKKFGEE